MIEKKLSPQQRRVIDYMTRFGGITTLQAYNDLGITSLPQRISELIHLGYKITKRRLTVRNRFKEKTTVILYSLEEDIDDIQNT